MNKSKCQYDGCLDGNYCYDYHPAEYVTHDMAIDAGERDMEGMLYRGEEYEWGICPCCLGNFESCENCSKMA